MRDPYTLAEIGHAKEERFNKIYTFVRSRIMEGTFPGTPQMGHSGITLLRVMRMYGLMPMQVWPVDGRPWPPTLPDPATEEQAKPYRVRSYHRIIDLEAVRFAIAYSNPVSTAVPITPQWLNADQGRIETPKDWIEFTDLHAVCLVGYDDEGRVLKFRNNWGKEWGDEGFGYLPYEYWSRFQMEAWIQDGFGEMLLFRLHPPRQDAKIELAWQRSIRGVGQVIGMELWAGDGSTDLGWAFACYDENYVNVHELYVRPEYRRQGIGRFLVKRLEGFAQVGGQVLRYWLSHIDNSELGSNKLDLAYNLGYRVEESGVTWAAKLIVPRTEPHEDRPQSPALAYGRGGHVENL
jgi:GNAT superfamily N-acetyltransferase